MNEGEDDPGEGPAGDPIRVVIADDHALYRQSLKAIVTLDGDIVVVGEAGNGFEAVDQVLAWDPDVVVIDVQMPRLGGIDAVRSIRDKSPSVRVLMLTMSDETENVLAALHAGVTGYLMKDSPGEKVVEGIRRVHRGEIVVSDATAAALLEDLAGTDGLPTHSAELRRRGMELISTRLGLGDSRDGDPDNLGVPHGSVREAQDLLEVFRRSDRAPQRRGRSR